MCRSAPGAAACRHRTVPPRPAVKGSAVRRSRRCKVSRQGRVTPCAGTASGRVPCAFGSMARGMLGVGDMVRSNVVPRGRWLTVPLALAAFVGPVAAQPGPPPAPPGPTAPSVDVPTSPTAAFDQALDQLLGRPGGLTAEIVGARAAAASPTAERKDAETAIAREKVREIQRAIMPVVSVGAGYTPAVGDRRADARSRRHDPAVLQPVAPRRRGRGAAHRAARQAAGHARLGAGRSSS